MFSRLSNKRSSRNTITTEIRRNSSIYRKFTNKSSDLSPLPKRTMLGSCLRLFQMYLLSVRFVPDVRLGTAPISSNTIRIFVHEQKVYELRKENTFIENEIRPVANTVRCKLVNSISTPLQFFIFASSCFSES